MDPLGAPDEVRARAYNSLAGLAVYRCDSRSARAFLEECLTIRRAIGDELGIAHTLGNLGTVSAHLGEFSLSRQLLEEARALQANLNDTDNLAHTLISLGYTAFMLHDYPAARAYNEEGLRLSRQLGNWRSVAHALDNLSDVAREEGDYSVAFAHTAEALAIGNEQGDMRLIAQCLEGLARLAAVQGQAQRAVRLFGFEDSLRRAIGSPLPEIEQESHKRFLEAARSMLDEKSFQQAWNAGHSMPLDQAIRYALEA